MFLLVACALCVLQGCGIHPDGVDFFQVGVGSAFLHLAWPISLPLPTRGDRS